MLYSRRQEADRAPVTEAGGNEIDLAHILAILWGRKFWILGATLAALACGVFYLAVTPPIYRADAMIQLEERAASLGLPATVRDLMDASPRSVTQIEILRSRMVLGQVVADLNLDWYAAPMLAPVIGYALTRYNLPIPDAAILSRYARGGEYISLDLLEVPPHWVGRAVELVITGEGRYRITAPDGQRADGIVGETLYLFSPSFALRVGELRGAPGRIFEIRQRGEQGVIGSLRGRLAVAERGSQSGILNVSFTHEQPAEARRILNAIVQAYIDQNIARSAAQAESGLRFIEEQLPQAQEAVARAEAELNTFRQSQQSVDLSYETQNLLTQITRIENELTTLAQQEDEISQRYTQSHPVYQQLLSQRQRLQGQRDALREETDELPETQRAILNLTRNVELAQTSYIELLRRSQELQVLQASTVGNVRLVDSAQTASAPVEPRRNVVLGLAGLLGLMAGVGGVLLANWLRRGVQGGEELEKIGLPVFATINYTPSAAGEDKARNRSREIVAIKDPTDLAVEAFRSLRTSLHFGMLDAATRSIAVTSTAPNAGKSFTSVNLSVVTAQAGQTVCLVDADMRRGQLRKYFDAPKLGLAQVLAGTVALDDVLVDGPVAGLKFLPAGEFPPNPSELLMRKSLSDLVNELNARFDLSIFDTPPVLAVTDPVIIAQVVGATIAVVRFDETPIGEVLAMKRTLESAGVRLSGAVLNGFDPRKANAGSYSYSYNYRYTYKKD